MLKKIPNILTIGRIIIVPFFVLAFYLPGFYGDLTALILFVVASFTDFLDCMLARMLGEESKLGELLDPIADKIIVATALILLVMDGTIQHYEVIAAIIILTREILISGLREFLAKGQIKLPVSNLAKLKTVLQMVSIALLLSGETGNKIINFQDYNAQTIGIIFLWLSAALTLFTGYEYMRKGIDHAISESSVGFIFLSLTLIFFDFAISITVLLVIPSKKESGIGVCKSPFLSLKKILAPVASAIFPS